MTDPETCGNCRYLRPSKSASGDCCFQPPQWIVGMWQDPPVVPSRPACHYWFKREEAKEDSKKCP